MHPGASVDNNTTPNNNDSMTSNDNDIYPIYNYYCPLNFRRQ